MRASDQLPLHHNAAEWFVGRHLREGRGQSPALLGDGFQLSYAQLDEEVRRFAAALRDAGIHRGERVAFILPDTPLLSAGFWGAIALGAVAVPINTLLKPEQQRAVLEDCDARLLVSDVPGAAPAGCLQWSAAEARKRIEEVKPLGEYARTHRDAFCFMLYSSGTTGEPKGVMHLQHDMWVCCETYGKSVLQT